MRLALCKWLVLVSFVIFIGLIQFPNSAHAQTSDPPCIHGMRIIGEQSVYLSHMGLFNNRCHNYQGLFEVSFEGANNPQKVYLDAQKNSNQNEFTIEPTQKFILPEFVSGRLTSFKAKLHQGQYERNIPKDSGLLDSDVTVKLKRVLHFRQFKAGARQPAKAEYLLFGNSAEQLAAHLITAPPDFDQVVALKNPLPLTNAELAKAVRLVLPDRNLPDAQLPLKPGVSPAVQINGQPPNKAIKAGIQYFLETADYKR